MNEAIERIALGHSRHREDGRSFSCERGWSDSGEIYENILGAAAHMEYFFAHDLFFKQSKILRIFMVSDPLKKGLS
jgi:hypothetical protein